MAATPLTSFKTTRVSGTPQAAIQGNNLAACDATEGNSFVNTGREILVLVTDGSARTVQFFDTKGVAVGGTVALAKEKTYAFGPFDRYNYGDPLVFKASNAGVTATVIRFNEQRTVQA